MSWVRVNQVGDRIFDCDEPGPAYAHSMVDDVRSYHMSPDEFQKWGYAVVDWLTQYQRNVATYPVLSPLQPGELFSKLPSTAPQQGEGFEAILRDLNSAILPGITHWQSPNFFGISQPIPPGLLYWLS
jgi:hypothetical protein